MADNTRLAREVGAKIKYLRQKRGLSQEALALSCDMNPAFLGHVERGMRSPTLNTLQRICDGLRHHADGAVVDGAGCNCCQHRLCRCHPTCYRPYAAVDTHPGCPHCRYGRTGCSAVG